MKIPHHLRFRDPLHATDAAIAIADGMPAAWHSALLESGRAILASMNRSYLSKTITAFGADAHQYLQFIIDTSPDAHAFAVNTLAPLFMLPDGSPTHHVRHTISIGIIKFSGLSFEFSE